MNPDVFEEIPVLKPAPPPKRQDTRKRINITVSEPEFKEISAKAMYHHLPLAAFVKQAAFAYCRQEFILPDPAHLSEMLRLLAISAHNINQLTKFAHKEGIISFDTIEGMIQELKLISEIVEQGLTNPKQR